MDNSIREADMYAPVRDYFSGLGYKVRGEVLKCDLAAERDGELVVVEFIYVTCENFLLPRANLMQNVARFSGGLTGSGAPPSQWMHVYTILYVAVFLLLALRGFSKKDIS